ncbi:ATP-binding protein [Prauserella oleivorans]
MDTVTRPALLIGRDHPASVLRAEVARTASSHGGLVLVTGEAGIGKTTLVTDAAEEARRQGALVLGASCWESETAPGYWPWMQVVRALRRAASGEEWASAERAARGGLGVLLGESAAQDRVGAFELYDAVTSALVAVSQARPVVVVLDDLHWADAASLRLLEFAAQHAWFERVLLVGTYRDAEVEAAGHALEPLLLALLPRATTVTLTGLEPDEVGALIARTVGERPGEDVVAEVHQRTGGNPFFVEQTARLWHSGGTVTAIAPGVRDAVRRRLSLLPGPVARLLRSACVLGREFHRQVLAACVPAPVAEVDRLLDRAISARLVVARGGGVFGFAHDLVRETLYDALGDDERRERHAAVVHAVDHSPAWPSGCRPPTSPGTPTRPATGSATTAPSIYCWPRANRPRAAWRSTRRSRTTGAVSSSPPGRTTRCGSSSPSSSSASWSTAETRRRPARCWPTWRPTPAT